MSEEGRMNSCAFISKISVKLSISERCFLAIASDMVTLAGATWWVEEQKETHLRWIETHNIRLGGKIL